MDKKFMRQAICLANESIANGGGPFGAVIVKDGELIATGTNQATLKNDPTAHAEISAIRSAAEKLGTFDLSKCEIYTSCEPCPMCLGAIYWAHLDKVYYGNTQSDAQKIGFDDSFIYKEIKLDPEHRLLKMSQLLPEEAIDSFNQWKNKSDKIKY